MSAKAAYPLTSTTGVLCMWNGTDDGKDAFIDYQTGKSNVLDPIKVDIRVDNIRAMESKPSLLRDGFQFHQHPSVMTADEFLAYNTDEGHKVIEEKYFTECEQIVKELTGAKIVVPFNFRFRETNADRSDIDGSVVTARSKKIGTIAVAHCDVDNVVLNQQIHEHFGDSFDALAKQHSRFAQINIWRPVGAPASKWPLALIDTSGVDNWNYTTHTAQVKAVNNPRKSLRAEKSYDTVVKHHPAYKYYYANDMSPEEILAFSSGDTDTKLVTPHTAFWDNNTADGAPCRRSIEVRSWVFFDEIKDKEIA